MRYCPVLLARGGYLKPVPRTATWSMAGKRSSNPVGIPARRGGQRPPGGSLQW